MASIPFQIEPLFLHIDRNNEEQLSSSWFPKRSRWWLSTAKKGVNNGHFQPVFGHFILRILRIQNGVCYTELVFPIAAIVFP